MNFKDFNGERQQIAHQILFSSLIVLGTYLLLTSVSDIYTLYQAYIFELSQRCNQKAVINSIRELNIVSDQNKEYNKDRNRYNLSAINNIQREDVINVLIATDLWHLPMGNIKSVNNMTLNIDDLNINYSMKQYIHSRFPFIRDWFESKKKDSNYTLQKNNSINTYLCNFLTKNKQNKSIERIVNNLDKKLPLHFKTLIESKRHRNEDNEHLSDQFDQLGDDQWYKTRIAEESDKISQNTSLDSDMTKLLDDSDYFTHDVDMKNEFLIQNSCIQRFQVDQMRELWIFSSMVTRRHLEDIFIQNNSINQEEELNKPHDSEKHLIDHIEKFTHQFSDSIFSTSSIQVTNISVTITRFFITAIINILIIICVVMTKYQLDTFNSAGMSMLRIGSAIIILFSAVLLISNSVVWHVTMDMCVDFHYIDSEQSWISNNTGVGNWFKTLQVKNVYVNQVHDQSVHTIVRSLSHNKSYLIDQQHQAANGLLNGGFVWKPTMEQISLIQEVAMKKFDRYLEEMDGSNIDRWNKMVFIYGGLQVQDRLLTNFNDLLYSQHMRNMVHGNQFNICALERSAMEWSMWLQYILMTLGMLLLLVGQTYAIQYIDWAIGQQIPHARYKDNDGNSKEQIDNKREAKPNTLRVLNNM